MTKSLVELIRSNVDRACKPIGYRVPAEFVSVHYPSFDEFLADVGRHKASVGMENGYVFLKG